MSRIPKFKVRQTPDGWEVNVPSRLAENGRRQRHYHKTKEKATEHAQRLREKYRAHGEGAGAIRPALAEAATIAEGILAPWKVSLVAAAREVAARCEREAASCPLAAAAAAWMDSNVGLRPRTLDGYRQVTARLVAAFGGDRVIATITAEELQAVLAPPGAAPTAAAGRIRNARALWNFAAKRGWAAKGLFDALERPKGGDDGEIGILTPAEARALLAAAEKHHPAAVPFYAVALFAGVRAEELTRLECHHVSPEGIDLPAGVAKKRRRRHITPCPTLRAWLEKYPFAPCSNWREVDRACRRLAGWDVASRLLKNPPKPTRGAWLQNCLRHSHATYALAAGASLETLLFQFGHTEGPSVLRSNYVGRASKADAIEFFKIGPKGEEIALIHAA